MKKKRKQKILTLLCIVGSTEMTLYSSLDCVRPLLWFICCFPPSRTRHCPPLPPLSLSLLRRFHRHRNHYLQMSIHPCLPFTDGQKYLMPEEVFTTSGSSFFFFPELFSDRHMGKRVFYASRLHDIRDLVWEHGTYLSRTENPNTNTSFVFVERFLRF